MDAGERCGVDPYWVCAKGLRCKKNVCVAPQVPVGGNCRRPGSVCEPGAVCVGTDRKKRCVKPMGPGGECGRDPLWICEAGLECTGGICVKPRVPLGESCLEADSVCVEGAICVGTATRKICKKPRTVGEQCDVDPFWVCEDGLDCIANVCEKPKVPRGGDCLPAGSVCVDGTVCAGTDRRKKCVAPMGPGGQCDIDPFWVCEDGLDCVANVCEKPKVPRGGDCLPAGSVCVDGTVCAGTDRRKKCVAPMGPGGQCDIDPFWVCEDGLDCVANVCEKPKVPRGGDCLPAGSVCVDGTVCAGTDRRKKCVAPMGPGERCGQDPFWVCDVDLVCIGGTCMRPKIGLGGDCKPEGSVCEEGLFCLGDNGLKKCVKGMTAGQKCGLDPFWSCQPGLTCIDRICKH
ncbi:crumbs protein precursor 95F [Gracilaria domingensis]|nr:crumbs protein precursor 95F [Gracilaria domingensis]